MNWCEHIVWNPYRENPPHWYWKDTVGIPFSGDGKGYMHPQSFNQVSEKAQFCERCGVPRPNPHYNDSECFGGCIYSKSMNQKYPRMCVKCGSPESSSPSKGSKSCEHDIIAGGTWHQYKLGIHTTVAKDGKPCPFCPQPKDDGNCPTCNWPKNYELDHGKNCEPRKPKDSDALCPPQALCSEGLHQPGCPNRNGDSEAVAEPCAFNCGPTMSGETVKIDKDLPIAQLWKLLDDIDTASDMFKPSTEKSFRNFYNYTMKKVSERFKYLTSDGYDLFALRQERERGKS